MTAIKTKAVTSAGHVGNLGKYLNDDRALLRDSQHIVNDRRWEKEMDATREAYGHNDPSRAGAKVTYMYHQVIGFNPDECSCNDGKMTPEKCMDFAREWVRNRYPSQEAVWVLHQEHCNADGTDRYAVHIGINRTDLETGKRLCEGRGQKAKVERANAMRQQDGRWGLRQMAKGERTAASMPCSQHGPRRRCVPEACSPTRPTFASTCGSTCARSAEGTLPATACASSRDALRLTASKCR